jgi:hypothetical protein
MRRRTQSLGISIVVTVTLMSLWFSTVSWGYGTKRQDGRWEQTFINRQVKLVYNPQDFKVGGEAVITLEIAKPEEIELDIKNSKFADEGLGLKTEHLTFDPDLGEMRVRIPDTLPSREFRYLLAFKCKDKKLCAQRGGTFYLPVFNDQEPILRTEVKANVVIGVWQENTAPYLEMISTNRSYDLSEVELVADRGLKDLGIAALDVRQYQDWTKVEPMNLKIQAGSRWLGVLTAESAGFWKTLWGYLTWDWEQKPRDVQVRFSYKDQYGRRWGPLLGTVRIAYAMPANMVIVYYLLILLVCTFAGNTIRWFLGRVTPSWRSEVQTWLYSWGLAVLFCILGVLLHLRLEPLGVFELGFTNIRGIVITGLLGGLMPDEIKARIQTLIPEPKGGNQQSASADRIPVSNGRL